MVSPNPFPQPCNSSVGTTQQSTGELSAVLGLPSVVQFLSLLLWAPHSPVQSSDPREWGSFKKEGKDTIS